jgi:alpha-tubulin suppressor-like RCC1 family protein
MSIRGDSESIQYKRLSVTCYCAGVPTFVPLFSNLRSIYYAMLTRCSASSLSEHSLAIDVKGALYGWGQNDHQQLGAPLTGDFVLTPCRIPILEGEQIVEVACGNAHSCVRTASGRVFCWGDNGLCQTGVSNSVNPMRTPHEVLLPDTGRQEKEKVVAIACGYAHTVLLTHLGSVYTFGSNESFQLGFDSRITQSVEVLTRAPLEGALAIARSREADVLLRASKGHALDTPSDAADYVVGIACGYAFTIAMTKAGRLISWGKKLKRKSFLKKC